MKKYIIVIIVLFALFSCTKKKIEPYTIYKQTPCDFSRALSEPTNLLTAEQDAYYFDIWKSIIMERDSVGEEEFNQHYTETSIISQSSEDAVTFKIQYKLQYGWVKIISTDHFPVKIKSSTNAYAYLGVPRDVYFDKEQVEFNFEHDVYTDIASHNLRDEIIFQNCDEVSEAFQQETGFHSLSPTIAGFNLHDSKADSYDPLIYLESEDNGTGYIQFGGEINLMTGECKVWENEHYNN